MTEESNGASVLSEDSSNYVTVLSGDSSNGASVLSVDSSFFSLDSSQGVLETLRGLKPKVRNLVDVKNDLIFAFDAINQHLLITRASSFVIKPSDRYEIYRPETDIYGEATTLRVNEMSTKAAIRTDVGLFVMDLPHVRHCFMMPPSATNITKCKLWMVQPEGPKMHFRFCYSVLQFRWHPFQSCHLVILYNDNYLRLMDTSNDSMLQIMSLGRHPCYYLSTVIPLGEHSVDFAFTYRTEEQTLTADQRIILVQGNGQILCAEITPEGSFLEEMEIHFGKKNYASQNWSIEVLPCYPPIVVILCDLYIYHFLLFEDNKKCKYLHIFETIKLCVYPGNRCMDCNDILVKDTASMNRYFIMGHAGLLAVMIPLLDHLCDFWKNEMENSSQKRTRDLLTESYSKIEFIRHSDIGQPFPMHFFGFGLIPAHGFATHVIIVLPNMQTTIVSLGNLLHLSPPNPTASRNPTDQPQDVISEYQTQLQDKVSSFVLLKDEHVNSKPEEILELVVNQVALLKDQKFYNHAIVTEIDQNTQRLEAQFNKQKQEMSMLKSDRELLQASAERIAEAYEEINENQNSLLSRFQKVSLLMTTPIISLVELRMREELLKSKKKAEQLRIGIQKVEAEIAMLEMKRNMLMSRSPSPRQVYLNNARKKDIHETLYNMNQEIAAMISTVNNLNEKLKSFFQNVELNE